MNDDQAFRKAFYNQLIEEALEPDDPRCVPLYANADEGQGDVVALIHNTIQFSEGSTQLLSGYRGTGKSTELKRLQRDLISGGYHVALINIEDFLDLSSPIDITDFLLALCGALGTTLRADDLLGEGPLTEGVWARFTQWIQSTVSVQGIDLKAGPVGLKAELKSNYTFRQQLQKHLASSVGHFALEARAFVTECTAALKARHPNGRGLVVLVDSIEHARGTTANEQSVRAALEHLFDAHEDKLRFPGVHLVYTAPPWLRIQRPNIGAHYDGEGLYILPTQKVRLRGNGDALGPVYEVGVERLKKVIEKRGDWKRLLGDVAALENVILQSGGHLRDLIRMMAAITLRANGTLPASASVVQGAIAQLREQLLPIPLEDARWLATVARKHDSGLVKFGELGTLARYFDGHLVLSYRNGEAWFDVHPLVREQVLALAGPPVPAT